DEEREEELRAAHQSALDLRCQLHTHRERLGNIKFEAQCMMKEFEKLRVLDAGDEEYREGVVTLHKVWFSTSHVFGTLPRSLTYRSVCHDVANRCHRHRDSMPRFRTTRSCFPSCMTRHRHL